MYIVVNLSMLMKLSFPMKIKLDYNIFYTLLDFLKYHLWMSI